jgi:hypothetical protein
VPRRKSLISSAEVTRVQRAHQCRHDDSHSLTKGDVRLTVKDEGGTFNYCASCGVAMVDEGINLLQRIRAKLV